MTERSKQQSSVNKQANDLYSTKINN